MKHDRNKNPYLKQIILSSCCAVLSLVVLAVATAAWFARNDRVKATNVNIKVDPEANLVISKKIETPVWDTSVEFPELGSVALTPVTHGGSEKYLLKYCSNPIEISKTTGYNNDNSATLADVTDDVIGKTGRTYFKDFTVLIASENKAFTNQTLTATLALTNGEAALPTNDPRYAAMVDVWVGDTNQIDNWKGTLRYVGGDSATEGTSTKVVIPLDENTIPVIDTPITVVLRCYFDGALQVPGSNPKNAYVRTEKMNLEDVNITVTFTATEKSGT